MEKIISILKESGASEKMQKSINRGTTFLNGDVSQEVIDHAVAEMICFEAKENEELGDAIIEYAIDETLPKIVDALGIKYQPDANVDSEEVPLSVKILETILKDIIK